MLTNNSFVGLREKPILSGQMDNFEKFTIAVVGLGYVGLPLCIEFGKVFHTLGFDISKDKIYDCQRYHDQTGEVNYQSFKDSKLTKFISNSLRESCKSL